MECHRKHCKILIEMGMKIKIVNRKFYMQTNTVSLISGSTVHLSDDLQSIIKRQSSSSNNCVLCGFLFLLSLPFPVSTFNFLCFPSILTIKDCHNNIIIAII